MQALIDRLNGPLGSESAQVRADAYNVHAALAAELRAMSCLLRLLMRGHAPTKRMSCLPQDAYGLAQLLQFDTLANLLSRNGGAKVNI